MDWNFICRMMRNIDKQSEMAYQQGIKEMILETALGWRAGQITEQLSLQLGSTERLVPDLLVRKDERNSFIVEVKKPGRSKSDRNVEQLLSYMKQLEIPVGICWGDTVEVYWKTIGDGSAPVLLMNLNFDLQGEEGNAFVSLFSEINFSIENILKLKNEREAKQIFESRINEVMNDVCSPGFQEKVKLMIGQSMLV